MALRTYLATLSILLSSLLSVGCALSGAADNAPKIGPRVQVFNASYDEVWRGLQKALAKYPIQLNNIDLGRIETDFIKVNQVWQSPAQEPERYPNARYQLSVRVVKGKTKNKDSIRVSILKNKTIEPDFFSSQKVLPSDGLEENALLYRLEREIKIERSLKRAFERGS